MENPIIETRKLSKYFRGAQDFQALKEIDLKIFPGEFVSIIGHSGSGKSTLLYVLSTLDTQYEGQLFFGENEMNKMSKNQLADLRNQDIGFVFQFHYLLPEFTVLENVCLPGYKLNKYSEKELVEKALEKLNWLGLEEQAYKKASQLSGGQQQRVAIARALINEPKVIFGDEPTGNLDTQNSGIVFDIFKRLQKEMGQTIVMVTHDRELAAKTNRLIELKDGQLLRS